MTHDEMIEAVAQSMRDAYGVACGEVWVKWTEADERKKNEWRQMARAAIRVIAPAVLDEAARIAPAKIRAEGCETVGQWERRALREAIRAMKTRYEQ